MIEKVGKVSNPLTIVAIFAAIVEVSASLALPFLTPHDQSIYIWFLMTFPAVLVMLFFVTLNFNHRVLYAPSDWKDESNFFRPPYARATSQERQTKLDADVADKLTLVGEDASPLSENPFSTTSHSKDAARRYNDDEGGVSDILADLDPAFPGQQVQKWRLLAMESEAKNIVAMQFGQFVPEQAIIGEDGNRYILDGIIRTEDFDWFVEIKFLRRGKDVVKSAMRQIKHIHGVLGPSLKNRTGFILVLVYDSADFEQSKVELSVAAASLDGSPRVVTQIFQEKMLLPS